MSDAKYWLGFSLIPEIGPRRLALLLGAFGDLAEAWCAPEHRLRQAGLENSPLNNLLQMRPRLDLDQEMAKVERTGAQLLTLADPSYPRLLRKIDDAPMVLYVRGTLLPGDERALSIVGTRSATVYGRDVTHRMSVQLAAQGVTIVSGLAHGIDAAAHRGALEGGGRTLAVLGCGIDQVYPPDHRGLAQEIVKSGALVTEFPVGSRPEKHHFPRRNRVISGLTLGVLVVEAPEHSGALLTVSRATEQGREVFAVPGNITSPASSGTNRLIQDGAKLVMTVEDILDELNLAYDHIQTRTTTERIAPADGNEAALLALLCAEPLHIDDLARLSGVPIATVTSILTVLELKGLARMVGHMKYTLAS